MEVYGTKCEKQWFDFLWLSLILKTFPVKLRQNCLFDGVLVAHW